MPKFSILVVCLNPGEKLKSTIESIGKQTCRDYEIIVKDGMSADGSLDFLKEKPEIKVIRKKDKGIYDAMNQAAAEAGGRYVYFLNCGDVFYDENVLSKMAALIEENPVRWGIYYGNIYERQTGQAVFSNPGLDAFGCYRNVPCHQACFYDRDLLKEHPFDTEYKVRADYEQFLWCFFKKHSGDTKGFVYGEILVADYEGGGFSETKANRRVSAREHKEIVHKYMSRGQICRYRLILWITLAPLRTKMAENEKTAGIYNRMKKLFYRQSK